MLAEVQCQDDHCCICLESLDTPGLGRHSLSCGHTLHETCVIHMRRSGAAGCCPVCRAELDELTPVQRLFFDALIAMARRKYHECFQKLSQALEVDPEHHRAAAQMGFLFDKGLGVRQDDDCAAKFYEQALCTGHRENEILTKLGQVYLQQGKRERAGRLFHEALKSGSDPCAAFHLANMCKEGGNMQLAEKLYLLAHSNGFPQATYNLANLYLAQSRPKEAETLYELLISNQIQHSAHGATVEMDCPEVKKDLVACAMVNLAKLYCERGRLADAVTLNFRAYQNGQGSLAINGLQGVMMKFMAQASGDTVPSKFSEMSEFLAALVDTDRDEEILHEALSGLFHMPDPEMLVGSEVVVQELKSDVGQLLNGCTGTISGYFKSSDRYAFAIKHVGTKLLKLSNLQIIGATPGSIRNNLAEGLDDEMLRSVHTSTPNPSNASSPHRSQELADLEQGVRESIRQASRSAAEKNAPLMDAILRTAQEESTVQVIVLEYSRNEGWFRRVLMEAPELEERRLVIREAGFSPELSSGAKCFLAPHVFHAAIATISEQGIAMGKRHVVVDADMEPVVKDVLDTAQRQLSRRERGSFKMKGRAEFNVPVDAETEETLESRSDPCIVVKRTFIHVQLPNSMRSDSSVRPTTV